MYIEPYEEPTCYSCQLHQERLDEVKYWLTEVIKQLYATDSLNREDFENALDELCVIVGIKLPQSPIQIQRNESKVVDFNLIETWKKWNNNYLKELS
jgi:hypothetical protein